jgi:hypothetical protein
LTCQALRKSCASRRGPRGRGETSTRRGPRVAIRQQDAARRPRRMLRKAICFRGPLVVGFTSVVTQADGDLLSALEYRL